MWKKTKDTIMVNSEHKVVRNEPSQVRTMINMTKV